MRHAPGAPDTFRPRPQHARSDMTQGDALTAALVVRRPAAENAADRQAYLDSLPRDRDVWVFGYGSLMWNPGFVFLERQPTLLRSYHRAFRSAEHTSALQSLMRNSYAVFCLKKNTTQS